MGMRMRLRASFDVSGYAAANQVISNERSLNGNSFLSSAATAFRCQPEDRENHGVALLLLFRQSGDHDSCTIDCGFLDWNTDC
jgi:hypothetical protein